jgi:hypothetical protein
MTLHQWHQWGLILEIAGFVITALFVGIILAYKTELRVEPCLHNIKDKVSRFVNKFSCLQWLARHNAITIFFAIIGTIVYLVGLIIQAISSW